MENTNILQKIIEETATNDEINEMLKENAELHNENDFKLEIKYVNKSNNPNPTYAKEGDSGFDLRANLLKSVTLGTLERALIPTGLKFELPVGMELQVRPRSGLAYKNGVTVLNSPGTVDAGFRGEVGVVLINLSNEEFTINHGDRIAQGVISPVTAAHVVNLKPTNEIDENTERGSGGYGSTGVK